MRSSLDYIEFLVTIQSLSMACTLTAEYGRKKDAKAHRRKAKEKEHEKKSIVFSVSRGKLQWLTVDALAPSAEEGRGSLRKVSGSREQATYPGISEWGNPPERTSGITL
jgi:hypothetical protein